MEFTIVGIFYILFIRYLMSYSDDFIESMILLCVVSEIFIELGFIFKIGSWDFSCTRFIEDILAIYCFLNFYSVRDYFKNKWMTLSACYLLPIVFIVLLPADILVATTKVTWDDILLNGASPVPPSINFAVITATLRFIMYAFTVAYIYSTFSLEKYKNLIIKLSRICNVFLAIAIFEVIVKDVFNGNEIWGAMIKFLFGETESTVYVGRLKDNFYELTLFTKEASHYAYMIFVIMMIKIANNVINNYRIVSGSVIICFALLFLSTSFSSILLAVSILIILLIYRWEVFQPTTLKFEIITLAFLIVFSFSSIFFYIVETDWSLGNRLSSLIDNYSDLIDLDWSYDIIGEDRSSQIRIISVIQALLAFTSRPLVGFSLNTVACHGATAQFLAGAGIIGLVFWVRHYFYLLPLYSDYEVYKKGYAACIIIYLIVNLLNSIGLRPFYELTPFVVAVCCAFIFAVPAYFEQNDCINNYE